MKFQLISLFAGLALLFSGCYEKPDWLGDNIDVTKSYVPVVPCIHIDGNFVLCNPSNRRYAAGANITLDVEHWANGTISKLRLYETVGAGAKTLVNESPFAANFNEALGVHLKQWVYTVPTVASNTLIRLDVEAEGANGAIGSGNWSFRVQ